MYLDVHNKCFYNDSKDDQICIKFSVLKNQTHFTHNVFFLIKNIVIQINKKTCTLLKKKNSWLPSLLSNVMRGGMLC